MRKREGMMVVGKTYVEEGVGNKETQLWRRVVAFKFGEE